MIEVKRRGRLGNHMFQYCFGRILAEKLGYALEVEPIPGFQGTAEPQFGLCHPKNKSSIYLTGHIVNIEDVLNHADGKRIILDGYFGRQEYYMPYRDIIKNKWLYTEPDPEAEHAIAIHIRCSDDLKQSLLPLEYYREALGKLDEGEKKVICTDVPDCDVVQKLITEFDCIIHQKNVFEDFRFLRSAKKIITSDSTLSWWAAFLSDAQTVVSPLQEKGIFYKDENSGINPLSIGSNAYIWDSKKYTYIETYTENPHSCMNRKPSLRWKIKKYVKRYYQK